MEFVCVDKPSQKFATATKVSLLLDNLINSILDAPSTVSIGKFRVRFVKAPCLLIFCSQLFVVKVKYVKYKTHGFDQRIEKTGKKKTGRTSTKAAEEYTLSQSFGSKRSYSSLQCN